MQAHSKALEKKAEIVDKVARFVLERYPTDTAASAENFVRQYYGNASPEDVLAEDEDDLYGAALGLWQFGRVRSPAEAKIRVYNPTFDQNAWHTSHTVIEIINDDMPFLVDSVTAALNNLDLMVHLIVHPVVHVHRNEAGEVIALFDPQDAPKDALAESFMHVEVDEQTSAEVLETIKSTIDVVLTDVRRAVEDWLSMRERMSDLVASLRKSPPPVPKDESAEALDFLEWVADDHFTFLGCRDYTIKGKNGSLAIEPVKGSGLGILRENDMLLYDGGRRQLDQHPGMEAFVRQPTLLNLNKSDRRSTVHRRVPLDILTIKSFNAKGAVIGERVFVGLFTSGAYSRSPSDIPYLRGKVQRALERSELGPRSHDGKALAHILSSYPRDELFQISDDDLLTTAMGILHLAERQRTAVFLRHDPFGRFVSVLSFVPRDRYDTELRKRLTAILEEKTGGSVSSFSTQLTEGAHARVHFIVKVPRDTTLEIDTTELEELFVQAARTWSDLLRDCVVDARGEERGLALFRRYAEAFPTSYREVTLPQAAVFDIERIEEVRNTNKLIPNLYRPLEAADHVVFFRIYNPDCPVPLSDVLPMLENMGLKVISETPSEVVFGDYDKTVWMHIFEARTADGAPVDIGQVKENFEESFSRIWRGEMENDGFNRLVGRAGLTWRQVVVLRAYGKFLRQARFAFSQNYLEDALAEHPEITANLVALFAARFDIAFQGDRGKAMAELVEQIEQQLNGVQRLDEDRILRRYLNLITSTVRTNFYQLAEDDAPKGYVSFKLDSQNVEDLPKPRPSREIFVYSPRVEAVHLRGGPVARGGLRWSDRREDFRTEILGLMKSQMVKNAVIVPVGSKGGFVVKQPPAEGGREAFLAEGIECYKTMQRGLLDITDNIVGGELKPPSCVVRHDADDAYLVVAADKGTAAFSDIANSVSEDYGFWLADAYASGGSVGYDHKKMGITAKGAWESVKRHFRELGVNTQAEPFTVIGVGDMSGDVFGNGMLLSEHIKLRAAFNHLHIFLDPDPDPKKSFAERERLFDLARGSWDQYNAKLISKGGGVFERSAKSIELTKEVREAFGIAEESLTPDALIHALLKAEIDLMWFGGIGTYIKADEETNAEVGDKTNDVLRVSASEVRAKVIGEGANLGVTQRGRIDCAHRGVRLNTDFIDNSAGVDCSDHEVNIKILLNRLVADGDMTMKQRNTLLEQMTDDVSSLVLRDNYLQTQALSVVQADGVELLDQQVRLMRNLERAGRLDRAVEMLPNDEELTERLGNRQALVRPELSILLSYAKITLYDDLLSSSLPDDPLMEDELVAYFPPALRETYRESILAHPLRREIIATIVTNSIINRTGPTFVSEMMDNTGLGPADIARAYLIARHSFNLRGIWQAVEALDNKVPAGAQIAMLTATRRLIERTTAWLLRHCGQKLDVTAQVNHFGPSIAKLMTDVDKVIHESARKVVTDRAKQMIKKGVPSDLAGTVAALNLIAAGFDLVMIADETGLPLDRISRIYYQLGHRLGIAWLRDSARQMPSASHWQKQATSAIIDDLYALQADLALGVIRNGGGKKAKEKDMIGEWVAERAAPMERIDQLIAELKALNAVDLSMLAVANRRLRGLSAG